jgi:hypothetical protein
MAIEDGFPPIAEKYWAAPAMREVEIFKPRPKPADAALKRSEHPRRFLGRNINLFDTS